MRIICMEFVHINSLLLSSLLKYGDKLLAFEPIFISSVYRVVVPSDWLSYITKKSDPVFLNVQDKYKYTEIVLYTMTNFAY